MHPSPRATSRIRWRRRLLAAVVGAVVAVIVAELGVRMLGMAREIGPSFTVWHAEDGVQLKRNLVATRKTPEFTMRLSTNSMGRRGADLPGEFSRSILCLGDSFTLGYGVDDGEEYPALLAARVPSDWVVVNAGIGNQGNGRWLRVLAREAATLKPAVVVLQFCGNDFQDNVRESLYAIDDKGSLVALPVQPKSWHRTIQEVVDWIPGLSYSHLLALGRQGFARHGGQSTATSDVEGASPPTNTDALTHAIAARAVEMVRAVGAVPVAIACAVPERELAALRGLLGKLEVHLVEVPTKAQRADLYYVVDGHWRASGHEVAAALLWQELQDPRYGLSREPR